MAAKKTAKKAAKTVDTSSEKPAKKAVKKKTAKNAAEKPAKAEKKPAPSLEAVARGAYLNYRRRVEEGLPGDSHGDWLEAERQLSEL